MIEDEKINPSNEDFLKKMKEHNRNAKQNDFMNDFFKENSTQNLHEQYQKIRKRRLLIKGYSIFGGITVVAVFLTIMLMTMFRSHKTIEINKPHIIRNQVICVFFHPIRFDEEKLKGIIGSEKDVVSQLVLFSEDRKSFTDTVKNKDLLKSIKKYASNVKLASWNSLQQLLKNVKLEINTDNAVEKKVIFFGNMPKTADAIANAKVKHLIFDDSDWDYLQSIENLIFIFSLSRNGTTSNTTNAFISKMRNKNLLLQEKPYD